MASATGFCLALPLGQRTQHRQRAQMYTLYPPLSAWSFIIQRTQYWQPARHQLSCTQHDRLDQGSDSILLCVDKPGECEGVKYLLCCQGGIFSTAFVREGRCSRHVVNSCSLSSYAPFPALLHCASVHTHTVPHINKTCFAVVCDDDVAIHCHGTWRKKARLRPAGGRRRRRPLPASVLTLPSGLTLRMR
jgi:hypothetical protein